MDFNSLKADLDRALGSAKKSGFVDTKTALTKDVYPLLQTMLKVLDERFTAVEATLYELIEGEDSLIQPDLAGKIVTIIMLGLQLADRIQAPDDLTAKVIQEYREQAKNVLEDVRDSTIGDEEETEAGGGGEASAAGAPTDEEDADDEEDEDEDEDEVGEEENA